MTLGAVEFPRAGTPHPSGARGLFSLLKQGAPYRGHLQQLLNLPEDERSGLLKQFSQRERAGLESLLRYDWSLYARPKQLQPPGEWRYWILLAGRSFGKTRTGAEWIRSIAESGRHEWITIVGPTREWVYKVMLKGPAGLVRISPPWFQPHHVPSRTLLEYPNGVMVRYYSAERPERLRGEQHEIVWCDELAAWPKPETFDHLDLGLRLGASPRMLITTTPKPSPLITDLVLGPKGQDGVRRPRPDAVLVKGSTDENRDNLSPKYVETVRAKYGDTRFGRQELDAELLERSGNELWTERLIEDTRVRGIVVPLKRVVVGVDPTRSEDPGDECGIVVVGLGEDGHAYVMDDRSLYASPAGWARAAVAALNEYRAECIVYERSGFSRAIEDVLKSADAGDRRVVWRPVWASASGGQTKQVRAEPVSALYEQGRVHHAKPLALLEDEMCNWDPQSKVSPNRMDALVWAVTDLLLGEQRRPLVVR